MKNNKLFYNEISNYKIYSYTDVFFIKYVLFIIFTIKAYLNIIKNLKNNILIGLERLRPVYAPKDFLEVLFSLHNPNYRMIS